MNPKSADPKNRIRVCRMGSWKWLRKAVFAHVDSTAEEPNQTAPVAATAAIEGAVEDDDIMIAIE